MAAYFYQIILYSKMSNILRSVKWI